MGEGSYNDTFAMTRKDEELLVGAILQKIVVPHPAVTNLQAIEVSTPVLHARTKVTSNVFKSIGTNEMRVYRSIYLSAQVDA